MKQAAIQSVPLPKARHLLLAAAVLCMSSSAASQSLAPEEVPIQAVRLATGERIELQAGLSAPVWQRAPVFDRFVEHDPIRGASTAYTTRVRVLYDDAALYIGVEALDPKPAEIRTALVRHDKVFRTQDFILVLLDAMGQRKAAQFFRGNPLGLTADGLFTADNNKEDLSPDFDFETHGQITAQGYEVIFRIPYSSLRFTVSEGGAAQPWRIMVARRIPREQIKLDLSVLLPREARSFIDAMQPLAGFEPPKNQSFLQLRPTLTARQTRDATSQDEALIASLDVKWRPNAQWVFDASLNPDFSQVELDVPRLARNTRFALFLTEKRPIFLESADVWLSPTDALYTRSINNPRSVWRASWRGDSRSGGQSATLLFADDRGGGLTLLPGAYGSGGATQSPNRTLMTRYRFDTSEAGGLNWGALVTHRSYAANGLSLGENTVMALDARQRLGGSGWGWRAQWLGSETTAHANGQGGLKLAKRTQGQRLFAAVEHRSQSGEFSTTFDWVSPDFRHDAGFVSQSGVRSVSLYANRKHYDQELAFWPGTRASELSLYLRGGHTADARSFAIAGAQKGQTISGSLIPGLWMRVASTEVDLQLRALSLTRPQAGAPLLRESSVRLWGNRQFAGALRQLQGYVDMGQLADQQAERVTPGLRAGASLRWQGTTGWLQRLELEPNWDTLHLTGSSAGAGKLSETALRLISVWHLAPRKSLRGIVQSSRYARAADAAAGLSADSARRAAYSLTYIWRQSAAQSLYIGATRTTSQVNTSPASSAAELFVKWQTQI